MGEEGRKHGQADSVDGAPSARIGGEGRQGPDADPAVAAGVCEQVLVGHFEDDRVNGVTGEEVFGLGRRPIAKIEPGAVLQRMADGMEHIGLDPKGIAGAVGQNAEAGGGRQHFTGHSAADDGALRVGIGGFCTGEAAQNEALLARVVARVKSQPVGEFLDGIAVEVDLELVHALGVIAGNGDFTEDGVADVDDEYGADFTTENVKVRDVEPDILAGDG